MIDSNKLNIINHISILSIIFRNLIGFSNGICIYLNNNLINLSIINCYFLSNSFQNDASGTIYGNGNSLTFSNLYLFNNSAYLYSNIYATVNAESFFFCISTLNGYSLTYYTNIFYENSNYKQINFSKNYAITNSVLRSSNCLLFFLICNNNTSPDGANLEFKSCTIQNLILNFNYFGNSYGLIRMSYDSSELSFSQFWKSLFY